MRANTVAYPSANLNCTPIYYLYCTPFAAAHCLTASAAVQVECSNPPQKGGIAFCILFSTLCILYHVFLAYFVKVPGASKWLVMALHQRKLKKCFQYGAPEGWCPHSPV
jgi:hypothetical protein